MLITKTSIVTGKTNTLDIDVTQGQLDRWRGGELIQNVMPHLSPDDREFLMSGMTPEDWEEIIGEEDPEEFTGGDKV